MEPGLSQQLVSMLLPSPSDLHLETLSMDPHRNRLTLDVTTRQAAPACPRCHAPSNRIHSRYMRTLADLPWADVTICLQLHVRKCFCPNPDCSRRIFTERLPAVVAPWARRTQRLAEQQRQIGLALGGAASERLSGALDCPAGRDTFLRLVRATLPSDAPPPRAIGVDDWARRKGQTYGSIVIDLERSVVIDLLPDRSAETFAQWLKKHPGIEIISRDRGGTYAEGATTGAPQATQVADRWHLLKNLGDALINLFDQHRPAIEDQLRPATTPNAPPPDCIPLTAQPAISTAATPSDYTAPTAVPAVPAAVPADPPPAGPASQLGRPALSGKKQEEQERRRERRQARYAEVCRLREQGWTLSAIADHVGLNRDTVRKYLNAPTFPECQSRPPQPSLLDPFKPYILERWNGGCHTGSIILRALEQRGYRGCPTTLFAYVTHLRKASGLPPKKRAGVQVASITDPTQRLPSSRGLTWLVLRKIDTLDSEEHHRLEQLQAAHTDIAQAIRLAQDFATIVRERRHDQVAEWLTRAEQSGIAPLVSFASGLRRDYAAVKAGVTLEYSNGPTEGHINRLKMLKRHMFGRAKLDLLKQRLMVS